MKGSNLPVITLEQFRFNNEIQLLSPISFKAYPQRFTYVLEKKREYLVQASTRRVIKKCCFMFGTSLDEALRFSRTITNASNKLPIALGSYEQPYIFIPTLSPDRPYTMWISYHAILNCEINAKVDCTIQLDNHIRSFFKTNVSTATLQTQITRAMILERNYEKLKNLEPNHFSKQRLIFIDPSMIERLN